MQLRRTLARLASLFRARRLDDELQGEIQAHLELAEREALDAGLPPAEARNAARRSFGNRTLVKEAAHTMNPISIFEAAVRDLRHGLRSIRRNPRYATMIILTLAICIGANTAIFSAVYSVLLCPLPVPDADRIVLMANLYPKAGVGMVAQSSGADYYERMRDVTALEDQAMMREVTQILEKGTSSERIVGMSVTPSWFRLVGVRPQYGRAFDESEGEIGNTSKVVLSHGLWQQMFGGDPKAVGREVRFGGRSFTVIGVMPEGFRFFNPESRFWMPLAFTAEQKAGHHGNNWFNVGRLKPGAAIEQAQAQVDALNAANLERFPAARELLINAGFHTKAMWLKDYLVREVSGSLRLLWGGAALLLLIGALNAAGIVVARTSVRTKEMGTRLALGAGLGRLTNQLIAENVVLAVAGGAIGLGLADVLIRSLATIGLDGFPRAGEVRIDATVALFAVTLSVLAGFAIALFSVAYLSRLSVTGALAGSSRSATSGHGIGALRKGLVVVQVGLTFVLLTGAALMLASFRELVRVKPGYRTEGVLTVTTLAPSSAYPDPVAGIALAGRILAAIRALPGVKQAGIVNAPPLSGVFNDNVIVAEGQTMRPGESVMSPIDSAATPGYFEAMGIRILSGRGFDEHDRRDSRRVVVIDQKLANRSWPGRDPVGRRMYQPQSVDLRTDERTQWHTVVGVVDSIRIRNLAGTDNDAGVYYFPFSQNFTRTFTAAIHTSGDPENLAAQVRTAIGKIDPSLALFDVRTMADRAAASLAARRAALILSLSFGTISLFLAAIGLYGVLSYLLAQRTREIGIRMAVGSTPAGVFGLFFKEGAVLVTVGLVAGAGLAFAARSAIERFLYGVRPLEPAVLVAVVMTLACIAFVAIAWPARQAARMNPTSALRAEG